MKNKIKKIISSLLLFLIIVPTILFSIPQKTYAATTDVPINGTALGIQTAALTAAMTVATPAYTACAAGGIGIIAGFADGIVGNSACADAVLNGYLIAQTTATTINSDAKSAAKDTIKNPPAGGWLTRFSQALSTPATVDSSLKGDALVLDRIRVAAINVMKQALMVLGHKLLDSITSDTVKWINSGFHGSPLFVQNPSQFFGDIGKFEIKSIIDSTGYNPRLFPFGKSWDLQVIKQFQNKSNSDMQYSLGKVLNDPVLVQNYATNFNAGGWNAFFLNTQYPQNNYAGYTMIANGQLAKSLLGTTQSAAQTVNSTLQQGMGFLSPQVCPASVNPNYDNMKDAWHKQTFVFDADGSIWDTTVPDEGCNQSDPTCKSKLATETAAYDKLYSAAQDTWASTNACVKPDGTSGLQTTTPGAVVSNQIMSALNLKTTGAGLDAALGNSISALLNAFMNHFLQAGLSGLTDAVNSMPSTDTWTYGGQSLTGGNTDTTNPLIVPSGVTIQKGDTIPTTISGGTPPYSIQILGNCNNSGSIFQTTQVGCLPPAVWTQTRMPDPKVATASLPAGSSTLSVTGVGVGQSSFVVQDSSLPTPQTATVQVTTNIIIDFNNPPATANPASVNVANGSSSDITLSGGIAPYTIETEPDSSIALGLISDNILTIVGTAPGTSSITLQDSSTPNQTITVKIQIGNQTGLAASPSSISTANDASTQNASATTTISGGTPPYTIQKQPASSIGTAEISGNTLTLLTLSAGNDSVTVQDSFLPTPNTLTIPITATNTPPAAADINFDAPAAKAISLNVSNSTKLTMSGGSGAGTYSIKSQSDSSVASASIYLDTITITGTVAGNDLVTVQDLSSPAKSVVINVTVGGGQIPSLNVPGSVSLVANTSQSVTISGGVSPYKIKKGPPPDTSIASVVLNQDNSSLTIVGNAAGTTSVIIQDASSQTQSASITISVTAAPVLLVSPQSVSIGAGDYSTITMSGGQAPYNVTTAPDSTIATYKVSSANSIVITGVAAGKSTSMVITDASGTSQTVTITTTTAAPLGTCTYGSMPVPNITQAECTTIGGTNWVAN